VTTNVGFSGGWSRPAWSPDSARLIFGCEIEAGNQDICAINADGSGFLRLTDDPAQDGDPTWSPDGGTIVFVSTRWTAYYELAVMRADGSGVTRLGGGIAGSRPAWSPDGSLIAFTASNWDAEFGIGVHTVRTDGTSVELVVRDATDAAWVPSFAGASASFGIYCSDSTLTCSFDASSSVGSITDFAWSFGDGTTGSGELVSHTYLDGGDLSIELRVTDTRGRTASHVESIHLNRRPVASLTVSCHKFSTCVFDATASYDPDGPIRGVKWTFGDGTGSGCGGNCPLTTSHTYAAPGTYTATVEITDDSYLAATVSRTVIVGRIRRNP
jgi:PKD repeat protein